MARVAVAEAARRAVRAALDISMFIRTHKPTGHIFYLGSIPRYERRSVRSLLATSLRVILAIFENDLRNETEICT